MMKRCAASPSRCEVVTIDWENVSVAALRKLRRQTRVSPPPAAIATAQDRVSEKRLFEKLGIATTRWRAVSTRRQLDAAVREIGLPGVLKTRRMGYDGKGQSCAAHARLRWNAAWSQLGQVPLLYEELVPFDLEVSVIGVRGRQRRVPGLSAQSQSALRRHSAPDAGAVRQCAAEPSGPRAMFRP